LAYEAGGSVIEREAVLRESFPFGPVLLVAGEKTAYSWDRILSIALMQDL
jgi:hypothetical protein